jgi:hypothetical protein
MNNKIPRKSVVYADKTYGTETRNQEFDDFVEVETSQFDRAIDVLFTPVSECPYRSLAYLHGHDDKLEIYDQGSGLILVSSAGRQIRSIGFAGFDEEGLVKITRELGLPSEVKGH